MSNKKMSAQGGCASNAKQKLKKASYWLSVTTIGIILGISLQFTRAWVEPSVAPPAGNIGAPINTGTIDQTKRGGLGVVGALVVSGNVGIGVAESGSISPGLKLDVEGNVGATAYCDKDGSNCKTISEITAKLTPAIMLGTPIRTGVYGEYPNRSNPKVFICPTGQVLCGHEHYDWGTDNAMYCCPISITFQ